MVEIGLSLSSEEHAPNTLVQLARRAEEAGFSYALISDHYHPWISTQGNSPFVWGVIGAIAQVTKKIRLGTGVTCPTMRIHPAIIAQATATSAMMMPDRFFVGVGTGENLNEHIFGDRWPPHEIRLERLEEAVAIMRKLWTGETVNHWGKHYTVEDARLFSIPETAPRIMVAADGPRAIDAAGRIGDGFIGLAPEREMVEHFRKAGGGDKPCFGQMKVCWAETEEEGLERAYRLWPTSGLGGEISWELRTVVHFEQAVKGVRKEDLKEKIPCGPDPGNYLKAFRKFIDAGYDHVSVHQIGADQEGFFRFFNEKVLPQIRSMATA